MPPPPLPPPEPPRKGLITTAYVFSGLGIVPILGWFSAFVGLILGVVLCIKNKTQHGVINIAISAFCIMVIGPMVAIVTIAILTVLGNQLKNIYSQVTVETHGSAFPEDSPPK
jgi:hypothetical protein